MVKNKKKPNEKRRGNHGKFNIKEIKKKINEELYSKKGEKIQIKVKIYILRYLYQTTHLKIKKIERKNITTNIQFTWQNNSIQHL